MPDRIYGGLCERVTECEGSRQTERCHGGVDDGLALNALIIERVLYGGHKRRQRGHVRSQRVASSSLDVCEGMAQMIRKCFIHDDQRRVSCRRIAASSGYSAPLN